MIERIISGYTYKKFKTELFDNNINGLIKKGKTKVGSIEIKS